MSNNVPIVKSLERQIEQWVRGESTHLQHDPPRRGIKAPDIDCCPDFSCCRPQLLAPLKQRVAFQRADQRERMEMAMQFFGVFVESIPSVAATEMLPSGQSIAVATVKRWRMYNK